MRRVVFLSAVAVRLTLPTPALACRCTEPESTAAAYRAARAVVIAKVLELRPTADGFTAMLSVIQAWKQAVPRRTLVASRTTCKYDLQPDGEYLLYLVHDPKMLEGKTDGTYTTGICLGNKPRAKASESIRWLNGHGRATAIRAAP